MQLLCNKEDLLKAISAVEGIVRSKLNFSHLSNILLETEDGRLVLKATNGELSQVAFVDAEIEVPGEIVITQSKLANLLRNLPNGKLHIKVNDENVMLIKPTETKRSVKVTLLGIPADDYPKMKPFPKGPYYVLEKSFLKKMISKVVFAVSSQATRYALHGVFFELNKSQLVLVATDTRKMSVFKTVLPSDHEEKIGIILPQETLTHLQRNLLDEGPVNFMVDNNQIYFKFDQMRLSSSLINGEFPKYEMLLPKTSEATMSAKTADIINATNLGSSILDQSQTPKLVWKISKGKLHIYSQESNYNKVDENLEVEFEGPEIEIGLNAKMLLEILRNIDTDEVVFQFNNETSPVIIKEKGRNESTYVVMPVKLGI